MAKRFMVGRPTLKSIKSKDKQYKLLDRNGLYVAVSKSGKLSFRYDYHINGWRETITIGKYGELLQFFKSLDKEVK